MEVLQVIITYEKTQSFFDKGFETAGMSRGITGDEIKEIQDNFKSALSFLMSSPGDAPCYIFKMLQSGRYFICRIGLYEDTESYICHGLIVQDGFFPLHPACLIDSPIFNQCFDTEKGKCAELPALYELEAGNTINYESISSFVKQRLDSGFKDMVSGVLNYKRTSVPLIIFDEPENLNLWIGALQSAFPLEMCHSISFSTCGADMDGIMVQGISSGDSSTNQKDGKFVFDYRLGMKCTFKNHPNFIKIINTGLTLSKASLDVFHRFINSFSLREISWDMEGCYNLFVLCNFRGFNISCSEIESSFKFALDYTPLEMLEDILNMIEPSMTRVVGLSDFSTAETSLKFIYKAALESKKPVLIERAGYYFNSFADHLALRSGNIDIEGAERLYEEVSALNRGKNIIFFKYSLLDERINYLKSRLTDGCPPGAARFYLSILLRNSMEMGYYWSQMLHGESIRVFVDSCISLICDSIEDILHVIDVSGPNDEYMARIAVLLYNRIKSESVMSGFIEHFAMIMDSKDDAQRLSIRKAISSLGCARLIFDEYALRIANTPDITGTFYDFEKNVFENIHEFSKMYFSEAVKLYVQKLPFEYAHEECLKLIKSLTENNLVLENDALSSLTAAFEDSITLVPPSNEVRAVIPQLKKIKKSRDIITKPNITGMIDFGIWLEGLGQSHTMDDIFDEPLDIEVIDEKRYEGFIMWYVPNIIGYAASPEDYKRMMHILGREGMDLFVHLACLRSIDDMIGKDSARGPNLLLQFSVYYFFYLEPRCKMIGDEGLLENIRISLQDTLAKQSKELVKSFDADLKREFEIRRLSLPVQWGLIYNEVMGKNDSRSKGSILNIFKKVKS